MTVNKKHIKSVDGAKIYYEVALSHNEDLCLVFLHGLGGSLTAWDKEREFFYNRGLPTAAVDLRGHGFSGRSDKEDFYDLHNFASDVHEIMKAENFANYVLVGHCFGGMISILLEATYPKSSRSLVLVDTSFKPPHFVEEIKKHPLLIKMLSLLARYSPSSYIHEHENFEQFLGTSDYDPKRIASDLLHTSLKSYLLICKKLLNYDAISLLGKILVPTLVVDGTDDSIFPPAVAKSLQSRIKRSQLDLIPNANHILVVNNPNDLVSEVDNFLVHQNLLKNIQKS